MNLLLVGDVVGRAGRRTVDTLLPGLRAEFEVDLVVANAENAAAGFGVTTSVVQELFDSGCDLLTGGNHIWDRREGYAVLDDERRLMRPANAPPGSPGRGWWRGKTSEGVDLGVLNLQGRALLPGAMDCPFRTVDAILKGPLRSCDVVIIDFHAEATSEKRAMGWFVDGRVGAMIGTHTHVQTADEEVLPGGTAYLTDVGMTGPHRSVIGSAIEPALARFLDGVPTRLTVAEGQNRLHGVLIELDAATGHAINVRRIRKDISQLPDQHRKAFDEG
jgi:2',3'-cyclic-nucleotide 2'-phosphodiesterase